MSQLFSLKDRVVVVTGGLGQLGAQFARALAEHGARVAVIDLAVRPTLRASLPGDLEERYMYVAGDIRDRRQMELALAAIEARWEAPFGLINNAALDSPPDASPSETGPFETFPMSSWDRVMEVNLGGAFVCSQVFGGRMAEMGRGSIVNISSIYGLVSPDQRIYEYRRHTGVPFTKPVAYSVSKSGLFGLTRYLATYWAAHGVRVNTLSLAGVFNSQDPQFVSAYLERMPVGRMAEESEYNGAIIFLCADASRYMTGANLVIDGGWTAW